MSKTRDKPRLESNGEDSSVFSEISRSFRGLPAQHEGLTILGILLALGSLYIYTLLPGIGHSGDTAKFQFVGPVLGTSHATGYPLYMALTFAFSRLLPIGEIAYRINLLSALFSLGCLVAIYRCCRLLQIDRLNAAVAVLVFAVTPLYWGQSIVAEVYTLHALLMALVLLLLVRWSLDGGELWLMGGLAIYALSFGHHMSSVFLAPSILVLIIGRDWHVLFRPRIVAFSILAVALSMLQYGYLFWRYYDPSTRYLEAEVPNMERLLWYLSGGAFQNRMFAFSFSELVQDRVPMFLDLAYAQYGLLLLIMAYGIWSLRPLRVNLALLLYLLFNTFWGLNYDIIDVDVYFLPSFLVMAVYIGCGLNSIQHRFAMRLPGAIWLLVLLIPLGLAAGRFDDVSQRENTHIRSEVEAALAAAGGDAVIVSPGYHFSEYFWYYLIGRGQQQTNNIFLLHDFNADAIRAYLEEGNSLNRIMPDRAPVPPGLSVYLFMPDDSNPERPGGEQRLEQLSQVGLILEPGSAQLYRVRALSP